MLVIVYGYFLVTIKTDNRNFCKSFFCGKRGLVRVLSGVYVFGGNFWLVQAKKEAPDVGRPGATLFEKVQGRDLPVK
jgi:hypothetical protein